MFIFKALILGYSFLFLVSSCSYEKTTFDAGSLFDPTWSFSKTSELTFDENYVEIVNGKAQLKPLDLEHSGTDFNNGTHTGTYSNELLELLNFDMSSVLNILPSQSGNIVGYWRLDGGFNAVSGIDGIPNYGASGLTVVDGKINDATLFDGVDDYINFSISTLTELSISAWVRLDSYTNPYPRVFELDGDFSIWVQRDDDPPFSAGPGTIYIRAVHSGVDGYWFSDPGTIELGSLYHIAVSYDSASNSNNPILLVNGNKVQLHERAAPVGAMNDTVGTGYLGNWHLGNTRNWHGIMDDVAFYSVALSENELDSIFENQKNVSLSDTSLHISWAPKWGSIVGYWKMDGVWQDSSGNSHNGTANGDATFDANSKVGSMAGVFDGAGDFIVTSDINEVDGASALSVCTWLKTTDVGVNSGLIEKGETNRSWLLYKSSGNTMQFFATSNQGAWDSYIHGTTNIATGKWFHVCAVFDGTNDLRLFVNGIKEGVITGTEPANLSSTSNSVQLGTWAGTMFNGSLDDSAIWISALSDAEVSTIYNRQKQKYAGHYDSEIIELGNANSNLPDLSWSTSLPFGKELVGDFDNDGNSDSESPSDYSNINEDFSDSIEGLWHFNGDLNDSSGNGQNGTVVGLGTFTHDAILGQSFSDPGTGIYGQVPSFPGPSDISMSFWVKNLAPTVSGNYLRLLNVEGWRVRDNGSGQLRIETHTSVATGTTFSNKVVGDGLYHHVYLGLVDGIGKLYIDGVLDKDFTYVEGSGLANTSNLIIGEGQFEGNFDELAIWSRALSESEIEQVYRRGANRIKFQTKSCIDSDCECESFNAAPLGSAIDCDGDSIANALDFDDIYKAKFIGPGGDGTTYYSETFNRKSTDLTFSCALNSSDSDSNICVNDEITFAAGPKLIGPVITYGDFPFAARPVPNPYFQYRVYMEADENTACSGLPCLPELASVNLNSSGSPKYHGALQEITPTKFISYNKIQSVSVGADSCASFQLSPDGTNYYYWDTSSWVIISDPLHRNTKADLEANIVNYSNQFGPGKIYIKAFLETNASQNSVCSIGNIDLKYSIR